MENQNKQYLHTIQVIYLLGFKIKYFVFRNRLKLTSNFLFYSILLLYYVIRLYIFLFKLNKKYYSRMTQ
jgi:hypothetical protein